MKFLKKNNQFSGKILLFNMVIFAIVIAILFSVFIGLYIKDQQEKRINNMNVQMQNVQGSIQITIDNMEIIATQLGVSPALVTIMNDLKYTSNRNDLGEDIYIKQEVYKYLLSYIVKKDNISRIRVFNTYDDYIYVGDLELQSEEEYHKSKEYREKLASKFEEETIYTYYQNKPSLENEQMTTGISIIREIKEDLYRQSDTIAYLEVEVSNENLQRKIDDILDEEVKYIVYDHKQKLPLFTNINIDNAVLEYTLESLKGMYQDDMFIVNGELERENISVMILESKQHTKDYVSSMLKMVFIFYTNLLLILVFIQRRITKALTKPLVTLCEKVSNIGNTGEMFKIPELKMQAEFKILSEAFNKMTFYLNESMERVIAAKTGEVKAQLFALQSQMNPHFIHNTLAIIQAYSNEEDYETINTMCDKLSSIIRYSSNYNEFKIELLQEIIHAQNYIDLVKLRYEDNVQISISGSDQDLHGILVPRFLLQPIIENCLEHGLKKKRFPWHITVNVDITNEYWKVHVIDDGIGMSDEQKMGIEQYIADIKSGNMNVLNENLKIGGLSIKNIVGRLYLEYQQNMIFAVNSEVNRFTHITFGGCLYD